MNTQASFDFPITDSIIPESPKIGNSFAGLLKNLETQDGLGMSSCSSSFMNDMNELDQKENLGFTGLFNSMEESKNKVMH